MYQSNEIHTEDQRGSYTPCTAGGATAHALAHRPLIAANRDCGSQCLLRTMSGVLGMLPWGAGVVCDMAAAGVVGCGFGGEVSGGCWRESWRLSIIAGVRTMAVIGWMERVLVKGYKYLKNNNEIICVGDHG